MKILAIGNSFSQDATHYLHQIAAADGADFLVANLYIGGCSLQTHRNNILEKKADYLLEINGFSTERYVSVEEALAMEDWDVIVTQQASHDSGKPQTYHPYLEEIVAYLRQVKPDARLYLQKTWAYESDSLHAGFSAYHQNQQEMYDRLSDAYGQAAARIGLPLIPCADVIQELRKREPFLYGHGGMSLCRDGFHMNIIYGRYLLSAVWYRTLTGNRISSNPYIPSTPLAPNAIVDEAVLAVIRQAVDELVSPDLALSF